MAAMKTGAHTTIGGVLHSPNLPVVLTLAAMIVGLAALLPLIQSSGATTTAGQIRQLQQEQEGWQARIRELEVDVAGLGSLNHIEQEAKTRLKMVQPKEVQYIAVPAPAPAQQRLPSRYLPPTPQPHAAGNSLWDDVSGWLPLP